MKRLHALVEGQVQGVFFRASTRDVAQRLGVSGYVRNLWDGRVEIMAEGDETALQQLLAWARQGPPHAHVSNVESGWQEATGEFNGFSVQH
jgi:acylphosphatase